MCLPSCVYELLCERESSFVSDSVCCLYTNLVYKVFVINNVITCYVQLLKV